MNSVVMTDGAPPPPPLLDAWMDSSEAEAAEAERIAAEVSELSLETQHACVCACGKYIHVCSRLFHVVHT